MQLIDIGANLRPRQFRPRSGRGAGARARRRASRSSWSPARRARRAQGARSWRAQHPGLLFATAGVHPHHASEYTERVRSPNCVPARASGSRRRRRMRAGLLPRFLAAAGAAARVRARSSSSARRDAAKPLFLHQRDAHADFMAVLANVRGRARPRRRALLHRRAAASCSTYLDRGLAHRHHRLAVRRAPRPAPARTGAGTFPPTRLLIETDAPYLLPRTVKPKPSHRRNEPMYLAHIVEELARDRGEEVDVTAAQTTANARAFYRLPPSP